MEEIKQLEFICEKEKLVVEKEQIKDRNFLSEVYYKFSFFNKSGVFQKKYSFILAEEAGIKLLSLFSILDTKSETSKYDNFIKYGTVSVESVEVE